MPLNMNSLMQMGMQMRAQQAQQAYQQQMFAYQKKQDELRNTLSLLKYQASQEANTQAQLNRELLQTQKANEIARKEAVRRAEADLYRARRTKLEQPTRVSGEDPTEEKLAADYDPAIYDMIKEGGLSDLSANAKDYLLLGGQTYRDMRTKTASPKERGIPGMMRFVAEYEKGSMEHNPVNQKMYEQTVAYLAPKISNDVKVTKVMTDGTSYDEYYRVMGVPGGGTESTKIAAGKKEPGGLTPAERTAIGKAYLGQVNLLNALGNIKTEFEKNPQIMTSFKQGVINKVVGMYTYLANPEFDPEEYNGMFAKLVQNAPDKANFDAQVQQSFQMFQRKEITGAQAAIQELRDLMRQFVRTGEAPWAFMSKIMGFAKAAHARAVMLKDAHDNNRLPPIPGMEQFFEMSSGEKPQKGPKDINDLF